MDGTNLQTADRNERLALIVDRCLESEAAYKLFDMLGAVSQLEVGPPTAVIGMVSLVVDPTGCRGDYRSAVRRREIHPEMSRSGVRAARPVKRRYAVLLTDSDSVRDW